MKGEKTSDESEYNYGNDFDMMNTDDMNTDDMDSYEDEMDGNEIEGEEYMIDEDDQMEEDYQMEGNDQMEYEDAIDGMVDDDDLDDSPDEVFNEGMENVIDEVYSEGMENVIDEVYSEGMENTEDEVFNKGIEDSSFYNKNYYKWNKNLGIKDDFKGDLSTNLEKGEINKNFLSDINEKKYKNNNKEISYMEDKMEDYAKYNDYSDDESDSGSDYSVPESVLLDSKSTKYFYTIASILLLVGLIITFFNLYYDKKIFKPNFKNATYDNILKYVKFLKIKGKFT